MPFIAGPNNELIDSTPRDNTIRFPIEADHAKTADTASFLSGYIESASYARFAETSSFTLGYILSASYASFASTASYLLGSVQSAISCSWAALAGHALTADTASYAMKAEVAITSSYTVSSSVAQTSSWTFQTVSASYASTASSTISASYSVSSSYSSAASSSLTSEYAQTASLLLGTASYAIHAQTASYVNLTEVNIPVPGSTTTNISSYLVTPISVATIIDSFPTNAGLSAKWLLSINDGTNFKTSEILAIWNPANNMTNFSEVTTNALGTIPVAMSVSLSSGLVRLVANPSSGTWSVKILRFLI